MTLIHGVVFDCADPARLAEFWMATLGYELRTNEPDDGWVSLQPPGGASEGFVSFGVVSEGKAVKNRVHLDIRRRLGG